ncbi:MAG: YcxB family protein [Chitinophagaceae bacterium]|nr:YcxB family protein [Chitinophagaceae bacterium]MBK8312158.1 YcxB family protein [Chitinophagaceae bacterium]
MGVNKKYAQTKDYFYVYLSSLQALVIPKKLFTSNNSIEKFDKFLTEKIPLSASFRSIGI